MALNPFVFHLHRYRRNVLLLALVSVWVHECVPGHDVHTLLEVFPAFEAHPQAAYTITALFFPVALGRAQMHKRGSQESENGEKAEEKKSARRRSTSPQHRSPLLG